MASAKITSREVSNHIFYCCYMNITKLHLGTPIVVTLNLCKAPSRS